MDALYVKGPVLISIGAEENNALLSRAEQAEKERDALKEVEKAAREYADWSTPEHEVGPFGAWSIEETRRMSALRAALGTVAAFPASGEKK